MKRQINYALRTFYQEFLLKRKQGRKISIKFDSSLDIIKSEKM